MKCLYCSKDIIGERDTKKFCNGACRQAYARQKDSVTKIVPVSVTKTGVSVTKEVSVTELKFTNETMEERITKYTEMYPDFTFIPNWIAKGFNSKEEAIKKAISDVNKSKSVISLGLKRD